MNLVLKYTKSVSDEEFNSRKHSVFEKFHLFWKLQSSHADMFKKFVVKSFPIPVKVRWHTYVDAIEFVLNVGRETVNEICKAIRTASKKIKLIMFLESDFTFMGEYYRVAYYFKISYDERTCYKDRQFFLLSVNFRSQNHYEQQ